MSLAAAARSAALALRGCQKQLADATTQQTRRMGGGGAGQPWHRAYDGKAPPAEFQGPEYVTYAGLTLPKRKLDADYFLSKGIASIVWFTMLYHFSLNWEEHWYGDIYFFERDVQTNGWDDEHSHGGHH